MGIRLTAEASRPNLDFLVIIGVLFHFAQYKEIFNDNELFNFKELKIYLVKSFPTFLLGYIKVKILDETRKYLAGREIR